MRIGIPKEIKDYEDRVSVIPAGVREFVANGHTVLVETGAGLGAGLADEAYVAAGAKIAPDAETVFAESDMIVKVKEPQAVERKRLREDQILFTYLHLAPDPEQTKDLMASGATCIAYETVTNPAGGLPLLMPMSEVAGRMSVQAGAHCLENAKGGCGMLLGGVPGVPAANVVILGGGVAGTHATQMALGLGANVTVIDRSADVLRRLNTQFGTAVKTAYSNAQTVAELVAEAELVIGTVLIPGASAPKLITRDMLSTMRKGAAIVDVAIDQGGCTETSRATTHSEPTYVVDGVVHYCVANMPGGVARTSTFALANATLPFGLAIANKGWKQALCDDPHLKAGLNVQAGRITYKAVCDALGYDYWDADKALAA
ncbi:alanine dehydrogenase [Breoghania sp.]|uniref:alanine dehydrogenase n=1 Tax=Breoghania sp. TaxID=2065378 RepID=UPI002AA95246|nr:alanine dehydrogenase [Breoghania sp.]